MGFRAGLRHGHGGLRDGGGQQRPHAEHHAQQRQQCRKHPVNGVAVVSGIASQALSLAVGNTTLTVLVTAQDGVTSCSSSIVVVTWMPR